MQPRDRRFVGYDRRRPAGTRFGFLEQLERRAVLDGGGLLAPLVTTVFDNVVVAPQPAAVAGLRLTLPAQVPNGLPTMARLAAVDAAGLPVLGYSGSATISSSDTAATLPSTVTLVNGTAFVPVTFRTAGSQTLTATDSADAARAASATTTVAAPLVATKLMVLMPTQTRAGVPTTVAALAVDAGGRVVTTFNGTATVASTDTAATLPLIEVIFKAGRATFQVTLATAGRQSVTVASLSDPKVSGTASTTVVAPSTLASFAVVMPPRVLAGEPVRAGVIAMDASGRLIPGYNGTATVTSSDPGAILPGTVTFLNGRAVVRVTFATAGDQTVSVRGGAAGNIVGSATAAVVAAPVLSSFTVRLPRTVLTGVPVTVALSAVDATGRPVWGYSGTVSLTSTDAAAVLPATVTFVNGRAYARVTFKTLGEQSITATSGAISGSGKTQVGEVSVTPPA
ncbi:MAG: hypothetical protein FJ286_12590 [Planctomycetes bacterium]|nr:hypothetical protein [Planctomycetota bacterium]